MGARGLGRGALAEGEAVGGLCAVGGEEAVLAVGVVGRVLGVAAGLHGGHEGQAEVAEVLVILDGRQLGSRVGGGESVG